MSPLEALNTKIAIAGIQYTLAGWITLLLFAIAISYYLCTQATQKKSIPSAPEAPNQRTAPVTTRELTAAVTYTPPPSPVASDQLHSLNDSTNSIASGDGLRMLLNYSPTPQGGIDLSPLRPTGSSTPKGRRIRYQIP